MTNGNQLRLRSIENLRFSFEQPRTDLCASFLRSSSCFCNDCCSSETRHCSLINSNSRCCCLSFSLIWPWRIGGRGRERQRQRDRERQRQREKQVEREDLAVNHPAILHVLSSVMHIVQCCQHTSSHHWAWLVSLQGAFWRQLVSVHHATANATFDGSKLFSWCYAAVTGDITSKQIALWMANDQPFPKASHDGISWLQTSLQILLGHPYASHDSIFWWSTSLQMASVHWASLG